MRRPTDPVVEALRWALVALVLTNLGFVALTEAAQWAWVAPLFVLTLLAPILLPLTRLFAYRAAWNLGVIGVFALLVHHVTSAGIDRLLEDGLLLAALCQVHLINNLSHEQKPDLLFFNSFLIAVMTSFLSFDVPYCALLVFYAPTLVIALELLVLSRTESSVPVTRRFLARTVLGGTGRGGVVLALAICAFVALPRDFKRRGLIGDWAKSAGGSLGQVDFSDRIEHRGIQGTVNGARVVATLRLLQGSESAVPAYWRGQTLDRFDGRTWRERGPHLVDRPWLSRGRNRFARSRTRPTVARVALRMQGPVPAPLFVPLDAEGMRVLSRERWRRVGARTDLTFRHLRRLRHRLAYLYEVDIGRARRKPGGPRGRRSALRTHLALPRVLPVSVLQLANQLTPRGEEPVAARVARVCNYLAANYRYLPPGVRGGAASLDAFVSGEASGGHCELFASAAAVILRQQRVPCRIVTGYRLPSWPAGAKSTKIRSSDAHAWLEVYDEQNGGWMTADPTPAANDAASGGNHSWWGAATAAVGRAWKQITGFDDEARAGAKAWLGSFLDRAWQTLGRPPIGIGCIAVLGGLLWWRRRRDPRPASVRRYDRAVARARIRRRPGETPRELVERARRAGNVHVGSLATATATHERERYGRSLQV